jgi:hypothetical protein
LIPSLHEGQNPLVIASEGARSPTGRSAPPQREVGKMRRMHPVSAAMLAAVVALIAVVAYGELQVARPVGPAQGGASVTREGRQE